jgi:transposase
MMRHALYEAANSHLRISKKWSVVSAQGVKLAKRIGAKKACVAIARKLAIIMYRIWIDGTEFRFGQPAAQEVA